MNSGEWHARAEVEADKGYVTGVRVICPTHLRPMSYVNKTYQIHFGTVAGCGCVYDMTVEETVAAHGIQHRMDEFTGRGRKIQA